jgi:hypothetical protein
MEEANFSSRSFRAVIHRQPSRSMNKRPQKWTKGTRKDLVAAINFHLPAGQKIAVTRATRGSEVEFEYKTQGGCEWRRPRKPGQRTTCDEARFYVRPLMAEKAKSPAKAKKK